MRGTVQLAIQKGVSIGAHPGLPDLAGFGRRRMEVSPHEVYEIVLYQVGALQAIARAEGAPVRHVKPHGALYNMAAEDPDLASAIANAVACADVTLVLVGLSGSALVKAGETRGLRTASEVFADRGYLANGALAPRGTPGALISDATRAAERAEQMVQSGRVRSLEGPEVSVRADTICIHGDSPRALEMAQRVRQQLESSGVIVQSWRSP
jgi:UPF0271 protein